MHVTHPAARGRLDWRTKHTSESVSQFADPFAWTTHGPHLLWLWYNPFDF